MMNWKEFETKKTRQELIEAVCSIIFGTVVLFVAPLLLREIWNAIAWECNLPQFGYWFFFSIWCVLCLLDCIISKGK